MTAAPLSHMDVDSTFTQGLFDDFHPDTDFDAFHNHGNDDISMQNTGFSFDYDAFASTEIINDPSGLQQQSSVELDDPCPAGTSAFTQSDGGFAMSNLDPSYMLHSSQMYPQNYPVTAAPPSGQARIAISRSVNEQFGQVTPPDDALQDYGKTEAEEMREAANDKSERARNAANTRHAKTKARKDSGPAGDSVEGADIEDKREKYREKNRLAAAKCRAKKKGHTDAQEEEHRRLSNWNATLKHEEQQLRYELSQWRTKALQHINCGCEKIHDYNREQAYQWSTGRRMTTSLVVNTAVQPSPSESSAMMSSIDSPGIGSASGTTPVSALSFSSMQPLSAVSATRPHSFAAQSNYPFAAVVTSSGHAAMAAVSTPEMDHAFSEFLQSSAGGQGAFEE